MNTSRIATTVLALALLAGCGNKGPLVLPGAAPAPAPDTQSLPAGDTAAPDADEATEGATPPPPATPPAHGDPAHA